MQLPSVPRMVVFAAVILALGLGGVLIALGGAFAEFVGGLAQIFVERGSQGAVTTTTVPAVLIHLVL